MKDLLRELPSVDEILKDNDIKKLFSIIKRENIIYAVRKAINFYRDLILKGDVIKFNNKDIINKAIKYISKEKQFKLRRVVNGTGIVIHTNLGRAPLPKNMSNKLIDVSTHYSTLEYDIEAGSRGSRYSHVEELLCILTGAEAALVVNNNAAAVLLALSTIAKGKEVIVSRGQLVEIGGSFRVPDVMSQSGAILKEVGTTNKTHDYDYINAINENTALILKVHTSNYKIIGFTYEVKLEKIVEIARKYNLPTMEDLESGVLVDLTKYGLSYEPTVQSSIKSGIDIVTFSGDKLLGGPQAGIILGKRKYIEMMKKNPLTRALRVDKMCLSALEYILKIYRDDDPQKNVPVLAMLTLDKEELYKRAENLRNIFGDIKNLDVKIAEIESMAGGGSLPGLAIPSYGIAITIRNMTANELEEKLRINEIPIITRIIQDKVIIDVRTLFDDDYIIIHDAIKNISEEVT